jgi:DNA primase large subunit
MTVLAEIEACLVRNRTFEEMKVVLAPRIKTYLPLSSNTAKNIDVDAERRKDLIGHYVLRLAFCRSWVDLSVRKVRVRKV